jgi:hypothetical protein
MNANSAISRDDTALDHLIEAMAEEILNTPGEKLLAETAEEYGDPHALSKQFSLLVDQAAQKAHKRPDS